MEKYIKEVQQLLNLGLDFKAGFTYDVMNVFTFSINDPGYSISDILSKLKEDETLIFLINNGDKWNEKSGSDSELIYNERYDNSIYWENDFYGDTIRIKSSMGSIYDWSKELDEKIKIDNDEN